MMKFVKSNFAKKLIIVLVILLLFNIAVPKEVKAWDLAGILMKPLFALITTQLVVVDVTVSILLNGVATLGIGAVDVIVSIVEDESHKEDESDKEDESHKEDESDKEERANDFLKKLLVGPDTIFTGRVRLLDANIFNVGVKSDTELEEEHPDDSNNSVDEKDVKDFLDNAEEKTSHGYYLMTKLKRAVSQIYVILRNICAIIMLAGLIYTGIRILISSNMPGQRQMWLKMLEDWVVGLILLIFSHIIMILFFTVSDTLVNGIADNLFGFGGINFQLAKESFMSFDSTEQIILILMLGYMIYLTVVFSISYIKRLMWICVLIAFAPVVSVMYAFGRETKQIYSKWLREYMMAVFVQPFHVIVYYVLVAIPLSISNSSGSYGALNFFDLIYALISMSFIRPAEKFMRSLFGMDRGVAAQASFDSGKQTINKIKETINKTTEAIKKVVTTVGTLALIPATGGGSLAAKGALETTGKGLIGAAGEKTAAKGLSEQGVAGTMQDGTSDLINLGAPKKTWNSNLTDEQIDELAEEIKPGDQEYDQYPGSHEINPEENLEQREIDQEKIKTMGDENKQTQNGDTMQIGQMNINTANIGDASISGDLNKQNEEDGKNNEDLSKLSEYINRLNNTNFDDYINTDNKKDIYTNGALEIGQALHEGLHGIMDTMYIDGSASEDWKPTSERWKGVIDGRNKASKQQFEDSDINIKYLVKENNLIQKYQELYPNKPAAYIISKAEGEAKEQLKNMSGYIDKGVVPNVQIINELRNDQKRYGLTMDEAISEKQKFDKFNNNYTNIQNLNQTYNEEFNNVQEAIPEAKDYFYENKLKNVDDMKHADYLKTKFDLDRTQAAGLSRLISSNAKKGKPIVYKGNNQKEKEVVDEINKTFMKQGE